MDEVTGTPPTAGRTTAPPRAAADTAGEARGDEPEAFRDALAERPDMLASRQPGTRRAVEGSLARLESQPAGAPPEDAAGDSREATTERRAGPGLDPASLASGRVRTVTVPVSSPERTAAAAVSEPEPAAGPLASNATPADRAAAPLGTGPLRRERAADGSTESRAPVSATAPPKRAATAARDAPAAGGRASPRKDPPQTRRFTGNAASAARHAAVASEAVGPSRSGSVAGRASAADPARTAALTATDSATGVDVDAVAGRVAERLLAVRPDGGGVDVRLVPEARLSDVGEMRVVRERGAVDVLFAPRTERAKRDLEDHAVELEAAIAAALGPGTVHVSVADPTPVAAPGAPAPAQPEVATAVREVAERVLVAEPASGAAGEVRIVLNESVLDGSEVRIRREEGALEVVFVAQTERAGQVLDDNRSVIERTLAERLPGERVQVGVDAARRTAAGRDDADGRSRQRYLPEPDQDDTL